MVDFKLSPKITYFDFTQTNHKDLIAKNREVGLLFLDTLKVLANTIEKLLPLIGELDYHSGFRYNLLNKRVGSSDRSQHLKAEALDFSRRGPDTEKSVKTLFEDTLRALIETAIPFGQLIMEQQESRDYGRDYWVHLSLGSPYRDLAKCGQVLTMVDGKYTLIKVVPIGR